MSLLSLPNRNKGTGVSSGRIAPSLGPHWLLSTRSLSKIQSPSSIRAGLRTLIVPSGVASASPPLYSFKVEFDRD